MSALDAVARKMSATIAPTGNYPSGRFPMPDAKHARLALQMLPRANNLSEAERAAITARARRILGK